MVSDQAVTNALSREDGADPVYTGVLPIGGGLWVLTSLYVPFPTSALVLDSTWSPRLKPTFTA